MTVTVGRTALTIPWPYVLTITISLVSGSVLSTWKVATFVDKMENRIDMIDAKLSAIQKSEPSLAQRVDSIGRLREELKAMHDEIYSKGLRELTALDNTGRPRTYVAHSIAGRLVWYEIKNNN